MGISEKFSSIGTAVIRDALSGLPQKPGVYRMLNAKGDALYIGKAKNLRHRVASYTSPQRLTTRILRMVEATATLEFETTESEVEALLLEANLIKRLRPRYNILLKDDKSFPYLLVTKHPFPRIVKHRGAQTIAGEYFGPFASVGALNATMALLQRIFLLRPCADTIFKNRTRPCLQFQIKRCSAPCVRYVEEAEYAAQLKRARDFLKGRHREVQEALAGEMQKASDGEDFEYAAALRDQIRALTQVQQEQGLRSMGLDNADVVALARRGGRTVVEVGLYRDGNHLGHQGFHPKHEEEATDAEVMAAFLGQFYQSHVPPREILVSLLPEECALLSQALELKAGHVVEIRTPQRGDKLKLVMNAVDLAFGALNREEQQRAAIANNLSQVKALFGLKSVPARIEVYDNSHIMGRAALGAMIVAGPEGFDKKSYRSFNIKDVSTVPGDDYAMMREVFRRRFKRSGDEGWKLPDLVLVDGGPGQLSAASGTLKELGVEGLVLVGVSKGEGRNAGREWFYMEEREPFQLPENEPVLHYLQRLRDEAHRFAIGAHRRKRSRSLTTSGLDDIPGIGPGRKKALLHHFGSRAEVERATLDELQKVAGISKTVAKSIYDYFHG